MAQCHERWGISEPCLALYDAHNNWIRSLVPEDELLEFRPEMGWRPLCEFLGKDSKELSEKHNHFPLRNRRNYIRWLKNVAQVVGLTTWVLVLGASYGVGLLIFRRCLLVY